jgi:chemotaxis protein MotB
VSRKEETSEKWLVTFADLMSLLFALFVLINSFSEIDAESFRKNAGPMSQAFNGTVTESDVTFTKKLIKEKKEVVAQSLPPINILADKLPIDVISENETTSELDDPYILLVSQTKILNLLEDGLKNEINNDNWKVAIKDNNILINMSGDSAFNSASAELSSTAKNALDRIIGVFPDSSGEIVIVGHTDDIPIKSQQFPSNWNLSSARASAVASYILSTSNIDKSRISVVGKADTQPISKSREKNRRIELEIFVRARY